MYEFSTTPLLLTASDDDGGGNQTSRVTFKYRPDTFYYIAVDGFKNASGDVRVSVGATLFQDPGQYRVIQKITGFSPAATCSENSDPTDLLCSFAREPSGMLKLTVRGENFTSDSKVLIDGQPPTGLDRNGGLLVGSTTFISSTELLVRVPPRPAFLIQRVAETGVVTPVTIDTGRASPDAPAAVFNALAANVGQLKSLDLVNATLAPGGVLEVCGAKLFNKEGGSTCIVFENHQSSDSTVSPTWFAAVAYCNDFFDIGDARRLRCANDLAKGQGFAINPKSVTKPDRMEVRQTISLPAGTVPPSGLAPQFLIGGGIPLVGHDGSSLIGQDGGSLVGHDGSSLIGQDGSSLIGQDGSSLIGQDGSSLRITAGSLISEVGSGRPTVLPYGRNESASAAATESAKLPSPMSPAT